MHLQEEPHQNQANIIILITNLRLAAHRRTHTVVVVAEGSLQLQVPSEYNCCQQQQAGHMIHNSVGHSSAERKERILVSQAQ